MDLPAMEVFGDRTMVQQQYVDPTSNQKSVLGSPTISLAHQIILRNQTGPIQFKEQFVNSSLSNTSSGTQEVRGNFVLHRQMRIEINHESNEPIPSFQFLIDTTNHDISSRYQWKLVSAHYKFLSSFLYHTSLLHSGE